MTAEALPLDPRIRTVWRVGAAIRSAVVTAAALAAAGMATSQEAGLGAWPWVGAVVVAAAATAFGWWWPDVVYRHWSYRLGADAIELDHGVAFRTHSVVPYFRVQHVDTAQGPIDRRLGLTSLKIHTASAASDAVLPGLAEADATRVRSFVLDRAGAGDAV